MLFAYFGHYSSLYVKSLAQKLTENTFFVKLMYVTICDLVTIVTVFIDFFQPISEQKYTHFSISAVRDDVEDEFSFYLTSLM